MAQQAKKDSGASKPAASKSESRAVALSPSRLPISPQIAGQYDIDPARWRVLVEQTFPGAKSVEAILMALEYCKARGLDILKRPVHIVPMWDSTRNQYVETVWPSIAEIRTTAHRTGQYAGLDEIEFGPDIEQVFTGDVRDRGAWKSVTITVTYPEWAKVVVYRLVGGHRCPFHAMVRWRETYATSGKGPVPNAMWQKRPYGQLAKCVEAAALREAFPEEIGGLETAEEMEGQIIEHSPERAVAREAPPEPPAKAAEPPAAKPAAKPKPAAKAKPSPKRDAPGAPDDEPDADSAESENPEPPDDAISGPDDDAIDVESEPVDDGEADADADPIEAFIHKIASFDDPDELAAYYEGEIEPKLGAAGTLDEQAQVQQSYADRYAELTDS